MTTTADPSINLIDAATCADLPDKADGDFTDGSTPAEIAADNLRRATSAATAVKAYATATGSIQDTPRSMIGDLVGDLRHLCDALGLDFYDLTDHYTDERAGTL